MVTIWYLWCQYIQYDLKQGDFHVGVVLFRSWQTTTQIGMAAWRQLQKFRNKRNPRKHAKMEETLLNLRSQGNLFCISRGRKPIWKIILQHSFLPREVATKLRSCKVPVRTPGLPGYVSQIEESSSRDIDSADNTSESSRRIHSRDTTDVRDPENALQAEATADEIIQRIMEQLENEVNMEIESEIESQNIASASPQISGTDNLPREILSTDLLQELCNIWTQQDS